MECAGGLLLNCDAGRKRRLARLQPCCGDRSAACGILLRRGHAFNALDRASGTKFTTCRRSLPRIRNDGKAVGTAGALSAGTRDRMAQMARLAPAGAARWIRRLRAALVHSVHTAKRERGSAGLVCSADLLALYVRCAATCPALVVLPPGIVAAALSLVSLAGTVSSTIPAPPARTRADGARGFWVRFFLGVTE